MQVTTLDAERIMRELEVELIPCTHQHAGFIVVEGRHVLKVHRSRIEGVMPATVIELFRKSLKLSVNEFQRMLERQVSREQYVRLLREQGLIAPPRVSR
jgi:hypothetical protein